MERLAFQMLLLRPGGRKESLDSELPWTLADSEKLFCLRISPSGSLPLLVRETCKNQIEKTWDKNP